MPDILAMNLAALCNPSNLSTSTACGQVAVCDQIADATLLRCFVIIVSISGLDPVMASVDESCGLWRTSNVEADTGRVAAADKVSFVSVCVFSSRVSPVAGSCLGMSRQMFKAAGGRSFAAGEDIRSGDDSEVRSRGQSSGPARVLLSRPFC